jgi:hypothetical protein
VTRAPSDGSYAATVTDSGLSITFSAPSTVRTDRWGVDGEEVAGDDLCGPLAQERAPGCARRPRGRVEPAVAAAVGIAAMTVLVALQPTIRLQNEDYAVRNPIGLAGVPDPEEGVLGAVLLGLLFGCRAAAVASVGLRFRRSPGGGAPAAQVVHQRGGAAGRVLPAMGIPPPGGGVTDVVFGLTIALVPVAAGIAILRYRLYDIDRIINRTLVYGLLTALLHGAITPCDCLHFTAQRRQIMARSSGSTPSWRPSMKEILHEGDPPLCWASPAHSGSMQQCPATFCPLRWPSCCRSPQDGVPLGQGGQATVPEDPGWAPPLPRGREPGARQPAPAGANA